jgi:hypothetical protein
MTNCYIGIAIFILCQIKVNAYLVNIVASSNRTEYINQVYCALAKPGLNQIYNSSSYLLSVVNSFTLCPKSVSSQPVYSSNFFIHLEKRLLCSFSKLIRSLESNQTQFGIIGSDGPFVIFFSFFLFYLWFELSFI